MSLKRRQRKDRQAERRAEKELLSRAIREVKVPKEPEPPVSETVSTTEEATLRLRREYTR